MLKNTKVSRLYRCFTLAMAFAWAASMAFAAPGPQLHETQRSRLENALAPLHLQYDPEARMLREPYHSPGYHTTLKGGRVHSTRSSLNYAVALLDTGDELWRRRAEDILRATIALQDQNPDSKTYGIWPWFLEEPLAQMSPPDWNWADFCGVQLLQVALDHRARLSPEIGVLVDDAIKHAARSIQRRNVGPAYTNIAIMGSYVTLVAAELYGWDDLREYALKRWRGFYTYTRQQGAFTEYNSPTYSMVAIAELGRMRLHVRDKEARRLVEELYRMAWEDVALHFHPPTRQWAGPHSRSYATLLGRSTRAAIQQATDNRVSFGLNEPSLVEHRLPLPCPKDLEPWFTRLDTARDVVKTYLRAEPPIVGTTHLEPAYTLGSINRGELWNQRCVLVAYWGSAEKPSYLRLRFLRDDYDFAAAQFFSAQRGGDVLAGVGFGIDGGNTHINLDRLKDGVFRAKDLRLRFEFGGEARHEVLRPPTRLSDPARLRFGDLQVQVAVPYAAFGKETLRWDAGRDSAAAWLDVVIHHGEEREFRLGELEEAVMGVALRLSQGESAPPAVRAAVRTGRLGLDWDTLNVSLPARPDKVAALHRAALPALPRVAVREAPLIQMRGANSGSTNQLGECDCNCPAHWDGDTLYLFNSAGHPWRSAGPDIRRLDRDYRRCEYDTQANGGRWIECTWKAEDGALYGWYHHEPAGLFPGKGLTIPRIGAVRSTDNGATWHDLGAVLEARPDSARPDTANYYFAGGHGDFSIMLDARKEYLYFLLSTYAGEAAEQGVAMARMRWSDREHPAGKVWKWHQNRWSEPGLGGKSTPFLAVGKDWHQTDVDAFWGPSIHWNRHLGQYVVLLNRAVDPHWKQEGVYISYNRDLADPSGWSAPRKILDSPGNDRWYPQVIGLDTSRKETDKLAGPLARLFVRGQSRWEIRFLKPGETDDTSP